MSEVYLLDFHKETGYLCKRNHKIDSVRTFVKEEVTTFSFIFLHRLLKAYKRGIQRDFFGTYLKLHGMLRFVCWYVTTHFLICCDANVTVLQ